MLPALRLGPLALPTAPVVLVLSFMLALEVCQRAAARLGLDGDSIYNAGYLAAAAGVVGARLGFVAANWDVFASKPLAAFAFTGDGLSATYGLATGLLVAFIYLQRKELDTVRTLDALAPGLAVLAAGSALASLASGDSYGVTTTLPWAISQYGAQRHPVQLYEIAALLVIGVIMLRVGRPFDGARFGLFVALYAASRLVIERLYSNSALVEGFRIVQVVSLVVLVAALWALHRWAAPSVTPAAGSEAGEKP